jgi:large subunit ribosomal protein L15
MLTLKTLKSPKGAHKNIKRIGRGQGSGQGTQAGKGHKGQKARNGGGIRIGFEGGQMPLHRRLPKFGFASRKKLMSEEVRLGDIAHVDGNVVSLETLKASNVVNAATKHAKVFLSGKIARALTVKGVAVTKGARAAIEAAGGKVEE